MNMTPGHADQRAWDLAGLMVDGVPLASELWDRPAEIWVEDGRLLWRYVRFGEDPEPRASMPVTVGPIAAPAMPVPASLRSGLLIDFVRLAEPDPNAVLQFARRWGVLHLCGHGMPRTHPQNELFTLGDEHRRDRYCATVFGSDLEGSELLSAWVSWAARARAVLRIVSGFGGQGRVNRRAEWSVLYPKDGDLSTAAATDDLVAKAQITSELNGWLYLSGVRPEMLPFPTPRLTLGGGELFGLISVQLAAAVTASGGLAFCHGCGDPYAPARQPNPKRRNYCEACRAAKVPQRDASAVYRRRQRGGAA